VVVQHPVVVRPPVNHAPLRYDSEPRRYNGPPSPAVREQQRARLETQQNYDQRIPEARRGPTVQPQSHGQGVVRAAESRGRPQPQQQHRDDRRRG